MKSLNDFDNSRVYEEYLRRYYAGQALNGLLSLPHDSDDGEFTPQAIAEDAVEMADALVKEIFRNI